MGFNKEDLQGVSAIYRYVAKNQKESGVHRNTLKKELTTGGKAVLSKTKITPILDELISGGKLKLNREMISLEPSALQVGILQKDGNGFYVVTPESRKHLPVEKSVASGYKLGDILDVVVDFYEGKPVVTVLGKSKKEFEKSHAPKTKQNGKTGSVSANPVSETKAEDGLLLGRVVKLSHDNLVFIPNKKSLPVRQIPLDNSKGNYASYQDKICVMELINPEAPLLGGKIVSVKGDAGNPIHEYDAIAETYGGIMSWSMPWLQDEISKIPKRVDIAELALISEEEASEKQKDHTVDLRHLDFATIDPATCKDMDDAIYSTIDLDGNLVCYTAVANVTKYVDLNSGIGQMYKQGAFTIYAPNKAYNILPAELSTGICSLNPNEDRLALVVKTTIDKSNGQAISSNIYDAIIRSRKKYSYEQAQEIVDNLSPIESKEDLKLKILIGEQLSPEEQILMNYYVAEAIKFGFEQRKMLRFNTNKERDIIFDDDLRDVIDIKPCEHLQYMEVIESFMITANEATAKFTNENNIDTIYRVHDQPSMRKMGRASEFFSILGIDFDDELSAQSTNVLIDLVRGSANEDIINNFLIKMQSKAIYSSHLYSDKKSKQLSENIDDYAGKKISHYALQSENYSHTTSPIRRAVDYVVHRNILAKLHGRKPLSKDEIAEIVQNANQRELDEEQAEKDFADISSVIYAEKHVGEAYSGRISKFRYCSVEEGYNNDRIVVIVKNEDKGISVEIPLSQVVGNKAYECSLSEQNCAVLDNRGNVVLSICKPLDFVIDKADRKSMIIVGKTNRAMVHGAEVKESDARNRFIYGKNGYANAKKKRVSRYNQNHAHHEKEREQIAQMGDE